VTISPTANGRGGILRLGTRTAGKGVAVAASGLTAVDSDDRFSPSFELTSGKYNTKPSGLSSRSCLTSPSRNALICRR
jgi:hypothetical protein